MTRGFQRIALIAAMTALPVFVRAQPAPAPAASRPAIQPLRPDPTLNRAEALLRSGNWKAAHDLIVPWLKDHPKAPDRDRALFLLADVYYQNGDRIRAFYHLDELMDSYPESSLYFAALKLQYDIADAYLNGYKNTFLGLPIVTHEEEAIEMLFRIQERSPGSTLAEKALRRTADYYFNTSQFDLAADAYGVFIRTYPRSPEVPQIRLRRAFSSLAQYRGPRFDSTPLLDARAQFKEIAARYPDLAADANVPQWIDRIDADLAHKAYLKGDFYARTGHPEAAVYLFRYLLQTYPNAKDADAARRSLAKAPAWALKLPPPPPSNPDIAASTQPAPELPASPDRRK